MIPISKPTLGREEIGAVEEVILSGWISQGGKVAAFEREFANYVGARYACALSSCTAALHLTLLGIGVQPGDIVLTVSHSFIATANAVRYCGAKPLFVDIDLETYNISVAALEAFLKEKTFIKDGALFLTPRSHETSPHKISALLLVHQIGLPCDLKSLLSLAARYHLPVVEDAACAVGSEVSMDGGKCWDKVGKPHSIAACFSFHPRKVLSTGEGGMITTNDEKLDQQFRLLRQHGMSISDLQRHQSKKVVIEKYDILGYNYRMTDIQAAIGLEQLKKLPSFIQDRREIDRLYRKALAPINWLMPPQEPVYARSNWQSYAVRLLPHAPKTRDEMMQYLFDKGIMTKPGVMNAHQEAVYQDAPEFLPESERARKEVILLPLHSKLLPSEIDYIATTLAEL